MHSRLSAVFEPKLSEASELSKSFAFHHIMMYQYKRAWEGQSDGHWKNQINQKQLLLKKSCSMHHMHFLNIPRCKSVHMHMYNCTCTMQVKSVQRERFMLRPDKSWRSSAVQSPIIGAAQLCPAGLMGCHQLSVCRAPTWPAAAS